MKSEKCNEHKFYQFRHSFGMPEFYHHNYDHHHHDQKLWVGWQSLISFLLPALIILTSWIIMAHSLLTKTVHRLRSRYYSYMSLSLSTFMNTASGEMDLKIYQLLPNSESQNSRYCTSDRNIQAPQSSDHQVHHCDCFLPHLRLALLCCFLQGIL